MNKLFLALAFLVGFSANAQQYMCTTGKIHFFSKSPLEDIEASQNAGICALNTANNKIYSKINVKAFKFKDKLMEEHFNENYLETDKHPNAVLDVTIQEKMDYTKNGDYLVTMKGTFDLHGVKKEITIPGKLKIENGAPSLGTADFTVLLKDYKIKIPKAVLMNIAESIKIDVNFAFTKYEKK